MKEDWYTQLSEQQKEFIEKGLDDLNNGRVKTHCEVMKAVKDKLANFRK